MKSNPAIGAPLPNVLLQWRQPGQPAPAAGGLLFILALDAIVVPLIAINGGRWGVPMIGIMLAATLIEGAVFAWIARPRRVEFSPAGVRIGPAFYPWREVVAYNIAPSGSLTLHIRKRIETWGMDGTFVVLPFPPELRMKLEPLLANYVGSRPKPNPEQPPPLLRCPQ